MAVDDVLTLHIDTAEQRITRDRMVIRACGLDWDRRFGLNRLVEPTTRTAMLRPLCLSPEWQTDTTGNYARLAKANYFMATPAGWRDHQVKSEGDYYLYGRGVNEGVATLTSYGRNRGFLLSWMHFNPGNSDTLMMECGWGSPEDTESVRVHFWSKGKVLIYKGGELVGRGSITYQDDDDETNTKDDDTSSRGRSTAGELIDVLLIPWRKRELLVMSNAGESFSHVFEDIAPDEEDPEICPDESFWWYVRPPEGSTDPVQACVQLAPMRYPTAGHVVSKAYVLPYAPPEGSAPLVLMHYDGAIPGVAGALAQVVEADGETPFVADGVKNTVRLRIDLTGDGTASCWVYDAQAVWLAETASTDDAPTDLTPYTLRAELSVPESPADVRLRLDIKSPAALETAGAAKIRIVGNRPLTAKIGTIPVFHGRTLPPHYTQGLNDETDRLALECEDAWKALRTYRMEDVVPLDGMLLSDAILSLVMAAGFSASDCDIEDTGLRLDRGDPPSKGEHALCPDPGDTPGEWLTRLHEDFARTSFMGWYPTPMGKNFRFGSASYIGATAVAQLFPTETAAAAWLVSGGWTEADARLYAHRYVYTAYDSAPLEPEANEIRLTWFNRQTREITRTYTVDYASQDPTTPVGSRPDNWLGERRLYAMVNPAITTPEMAEAVVLMLRARLFTPLEPCEWSSQLMLKSSGVPAWRGELVTLTGKGDVRIGSLQAVYEREVAEDGADRAMIWRPATYTSSADPLSMGTGLRACRAAHRLRIDRAARGPIVRKGGEWMREARPDAYVEVVVP